MVLEKTLEYSKETSVKEREVEADGFSNRCFATKHLYPTASS